LLSDFALDDAVDDERREIKSDTRVLRGVSLLEGVTVGILLGTPGRGELAASDMSLGLVSNLFCFLQN
jgi:hypothetical protein